MNEHRNGDPRVCESKNPYLLDNIYYPPDSITEVKCSSEGWKIGENMFQYVMCNASREFVSLIII